MLGVVRWWGDPNPECRQGTQAECALKETLGQRWGLGLVTVLRAGPLPQGQRKELSGPEGKGSQPCMEENELYSSATTGEGGCLFCRCALPRAWWGRGVGQPAAGRVFLPCGCPQPWPAALSAALHHFRARPKVGEPGLP